MCDMFVNRWEVKRICSVLLLKRLPIWKYWQVIKQTVMTNVYGVTYVGAREQIEGQLSSRGDVPDEVIFQYVSFLKSLYV